MTIDTLRTLLELGWPAIVTLAAGYLFLQYMSDQRKLIDQLWSRVIALETQLQEIKRAVTKTKPLD